MVTVAWERGCNEVEDDDDSVVMMIIMM